MNKIEKIKAKQVAIPTTANRYTVVYWDKFGWKLQGSLHTTPEDAVAEFMAWDNKDVEHYGVIEIELPIPNCDSVIDKAKPKDS